MSYANIVAAIAKEVQEARLKVLEDVQAYVLDKVDEESAEAIKELFDDFALCFNNADVLFILDIYAASEAPIEGITAETLTENIRQYGHKDVRYVGDIDIAAKVAVEEVREGDVVVTLGAGNVTRLSDEIITLLQSDKV